MHYYHFNSEFITEDQQNFIKSLFSCKNWQKSDRLLGSSKGRGITWFLKLSDEIGVNGVLRHYYRGGLFGKLIKDRYLFTKLADTRAYQEFELLAFMYQKGLPVPRPIALQIHRQAFLYQADILLEKIENTEDLSKFLQKKPLTLAQYQQIGRLIKRLHQQQIHHSDLNIHNILLQSETEQFYLIDFDKCQVQQGESWKQQNLDRLLRSFKKEQDRLGILFAEADWQALLAGYKSEQTA